jgi:carboxyl-terminal processing protease
MSRFQKRRAKALIMDLSVNMGGYDFIARDIANRFASRATLAYQKRALDSTISKPFPHDIAPHEGTRFIHPVYVLTSQATVSGGEVLTLALRALPQTVHAGQATRGAFSDVLTKTLPNGWKISLSNEAYVDARGENWEGRGIAPQLPIRVFDPENPISSHKAAVRSLAETIKSRLRKGGEAKAGAR